MGIRQYGSARIRSRAIGDRQEAHAGLAKLDVAGWIPIRDLSDYEIPLSRPRARRSGLAPLHV